MNTPLMITPLMIGTTELLLISGIALLLFGGKKLPELMRGMGKGVRSFKDGMREIDEPAEESEQDGQQDETGTKEPAAPDRTDAKGTATSSDAA